MKIELLLASAICLLYNANSPAIADDLKDTWVEVPAGIDWKVPIGPTGDTGQLQAQVLAKINAALTRGSISAEQASTFKEKLNSINDEETWYKSHSLSIPPTVIERDSELLKSLNSKVEDQFSLKPTVASNDAVHADIHRLITTALAKNRISNAEAEKYYSRLVQIESDMESLKDDPAQSTAERTSLHTNLVSLKEELEKRF